MMKNIRVLLVDDHQVVREGLQHLLGQEEDIEVVGQGANSKEALSQVEKLSPNVVLMDIKMPGMDGIALTRQIMQKYPSSNVIMLTLYDEYLTEAIEAGAKGYLLKDIKRQELTQAIRKVHSGEVVINESITSQLQLGYEEIYGRKTKEVYGAIAEEVLLVVPSPIDLKQLIRFAGRTEEILRSRVTQLVGSRQDGIILTIILDEAIALTNIMNKLENMPEVVSITEKPLTGETYPSFIQKALTRSKQNNSPRIALFVKFGKDLTGIPNAGTANLFLSGCGFKRIKVEHTHGDPGTVFNAN